MSKKKKRRKVIVRNINHGRKGNVVEAGEMLPLQEDRTYGKRLPIRTRRVVEEEGRPSKVCLYHDQSAHKGAKRKFHEDGDGE
jgi:hypothetical protein